MARRPDRDLDGADLSAGSRRAWVSRAATAYAAARPVLQVPLRPEIVRARFPYCTMLEP